MNLPEYSVRRPVTTLMTFFAALLVGGVCLWQLPIDMMPEMELPAISVITMYQGAGPADIETKVTDVLERYLSTVPELKHIVSTSKEGVSVITLSFEWETDLDTRANEVRDAVSQAKMLLPDEVDEPRVFKFNLASMPIVVYGVMAQSSYPNLQEILDDDVVSPLKRLPGVGSASAIVPLQRQVNVNVDREKLAAHGLTPQDVAMAILSQNVVTPAGNLKSGLTDYLLRVPGEIKKVDQLSRIVLVAHDNSIVRLSDVGAVEDGFKELMMYVTINGYPGAVLFVQKQSGANTVEVAREVRKQIAELQKRLPPDIKFLNVMDSSEDIQMIINDLSATMWTGALLVMIVVLLFLWRWRASLVIALTMPFSIIVSIIVLFFLGYTINMITLSAMIIAVGMIVDDAIVILENITRHREDGERADEGAICGANEVAMAVIASTLTTVCIFFPILFVKGLTKVLFTPFAVIFCVVLMASLFTALTMTPTLAATLMARDLFGEEKNREGFAARSERVFRKLLAGYSNILDWALNHRVLVIVTAVLLFASSMFMVPRLGSEFIPRRRQGQPARHHPTPGWNPG